MNSQEAPEEMERFDDAGHWFRCKKLTAADARGSRGATAPFKLHINEYASTTATGIAAGTVNVPAAKIKAPDNAKDVISLTTALDAPNIVPENPFVGSLVASKTE
jgi:hypothetical protein